MKKSDKEKLARIQMFANVILGIKLYDKQNYEKLKHIWKIKKIIFIKKLLYLHRSHIPETIVRVKTKF